MTKTQNNKNFRNPAIIPPQADSQGHPSACTRRDTPYKISETLTVSALLAVTGGILDAYTYLFRGKVFANGQTGNLVLLGLSASQGNWKKAGYYILPILSFLLGVLAAELIRIYVSNDGIIKWRHVILSTEIGILALSLFLPQGSWDKAVIIGISFVCALQTQSFRSLKGKPYISVMCTGNLRSAASEISLYGQKRDIKHLKNAWDYIFIVLCFIGGAFIGAVIGLLPAILLLSIVMILLFTKS